MLSTATSYPDKQFALSPATCPSSSIVGSATIDTPILPVALHGPAYLVSHGGAAFPDLVLVLQGDGVTIELTGKTEIKGGFTYTHFDALPDSPISSFELDLPEGPHSVLAATRDLCKPTKTVTVTKHLTVRTNGHVHHITRKVKEKIPAPEHASEDRSPEQRRRHPDHPGSHQELPQTQQAADADKNEVTAVEPAKQRVG